MEVCSRMACPRLPTEPAMCGSIHEDCSQLGVKQDGAQLFLCVMVPAFLDLHGILLLYFQITGRAHVLLWSATRCARDSSAGLSAQKHSAVPPWAEPGATPVRCAPPSPTPVVEASFQISVQEPVKVNPWLMGLLVDSCICSGEPFSSEVGENGKAVSET